MTFGFGMGFPRNMPFSGGPSLNLQFAGSTTLDPRITFTRASTGTYTDSAGVLQSAAINVPRFDYSPTTLQPLGLLIEEQRTNLLLQSEASNLSPWSRVAATVTADVPGILAPNNTQTADFLAENATTSEHYDSQSVSVTSGTTYVYSRFYKGTGAGNRIVWHRVAGVGNAGVTFNPDTLSGIEGASFVDYYPNGWIRVSIVFTASSTGSAILRAQIREGAVSPGTASYLGDGSSGFYTWGAQLEAGAFPTSYTPTTTAAATRSADVATMTGTNFSNWYNQSEGTFYSVWVLGGGNTATAVYQADDGTSANLIRNRYAAAGTSNDNVVIVGFVSQASLSVTNNLTLYTKYKNAMAYKANDFARSSNGDVVITDTVGSVPTELTRLVIGYGNASAYLGGHIQQIAYYPRRLSNAELQALAV